MAALSSHQNPTPFFHFRLSTSSNSLRLQKLHFTSHSRLLVRKISDEFRVLKPVRRNIGSYSFCCFCQLSSETATKSAAEESERPPFDLNFAVVLAGFSFEAYSSPPENIGKREIDAADCQTVFLSEFFLREVYDGQLFIKLKKGLDLPLMDLWGTSDPYVVIQLNGQVAKSKVKWATKEPTWNEDFTFNIKNAPTRNVQVAVWDANLVTPHKRMGNAIVNLESICDGNLHEVLVELEGMGGGGKLQIEVRYKSFGEIDEEKPEWRIPFIPEFLMKNSFGSALNVVLGSDSVQARQFVESAFGKLKLFNSIYLPNDLSSSSDNSDNVENSGDSLNSTEDILSQFSHQETNQEGSVDDLNGEKESSLVEELQTNETVFVEERKVDVSKESVEYFWKNFADVINQTGIQKLGFPVPDKIEWDGFDLLKKMGLQSRRIAEAEYVKYGLATPSKNDETPTNVAQNSVMGIKSSLPDIRKASLDLLRQTDTILGALVVLTAAFSQKQGKANSAHKNESEDDSATTEKGSIAKESTDGKGDLIVEELVLDSNKAEEMRAVFSSAESAMEAWAMLATSLGRSSFIKSEFEKICFLDNVATDTQLWDLLQPHMFLSSPLAELRELQVALWRDSLRKRLVVAFRGTEQAKWKDLLTDLMLVPAGLNPERLGGDFKEEVQVHSGFLSAYDSVRNRIMSLIKSSIGFTEDTVEDVSKWHVYVTGHSLGGALATLLALELSSGQMAKHGVISVTMYNFGSPRVGNKRFAEVYNKKVKDSWRVVNHRDIIPTIPRLMGYCHVAQPLYLAAGDLGDASANVELLEDGYQGDVIGEYTPDALVSEFMKGEKQLVEKILQTEISIFRSVRDGSALMQHMEDFYYVTLLESVRSSYKTGDSSNSDEGDSLIA